MHIPVAAEPHQARWWAILTRKQSLIKIVWIYRLTESRIHKQLVSSLKQWCGAVAGNKNKWMSHKLFECSIQCNVKIKYLMLLITFRTNGSKHRLIKIPSLHPP